MTVSRRLVHAAVSRAPRPLSHAELVGALGDHGLEPTTVFRNLKALVALGLVFRVRLRDGVWRYGLRLDNGRAEQTGATVGLWLHCEECDGVKELPPESVVVRGGLVVEEIYLRGRCASCAPPRCVRGRSLCSG